MLVFLVFAAVPHRLVIGLVGDGEGTGGGGGAVGSKTRGFYGIMAGCHWSRYKVQKQSVEMR